MTERTIYKHGNLVLAQIALVDQSLVCYSESATGTLEAETAFACYRETKTGRDYLDIVQSADCRLAYHIVFGLYRSHQKHLTTG